MSKPQAKMTAGQRAVIRNSTLSGKQIEEGTAELVRFRGAVNGAWEYWEVRFDDEEEQTFPRWVDPEDLLPEPTGSGRTLLHDLIDQKKAEAEGDA